MQEEELDKIQRAFTSKARLAISNPNGTKHVQYQDLEKIGAFLLNEGRGNHPWGEGQETPASLMARMSGRHAPFESLITAFDAKTEPCPIKRKQGPHAGNVLSRRTTQQPPQLG